MSRIPLALVVCCLVRYDSALLSAECAGIRVGDEKKRAATVLEVTVTKVATTGYGRESAAAVSVHRVWKGEVSKVATVYFVPGLDLQVKEGARYVIFASPQTDDARRFDRVPEDAPRRELWVPPCVGIAPSEPSVIKQLGRSRTPK